MLFRSHISTEQSFTFTYGVAAARVKFQKPRGMHGAFWLQAPSFGAVPGDAKQSGSEIDAVEYFGSTYPDGGLASFTYYRDKDGNSAKTGGLQTDATDALEHGDAWWKKYHVFSVEWTPDAYVIRIDGRETYRQTKNISGVPEFMVLSLLSSDWELPDLDTTQIPTDMTAGSYPDDGLGEVFLKLGKQGSTLAGVMDAFSMAISISLQYGVPLETYVSKFTNMEELRKRLLAVRTKLGHHLWPSAGYLCADVLEYGGLSLLVQDDLAPRGEEREALLDLSFQAPFRRTRQSAVADVEPELLAMMTDEVECGQHRLVTGAAQTATQLLQEHRRALRGPEEQDGVDVGQVETFVEQVGSKEDVDAPGP